MITINEVKSLIPLHEIEASAYAQIIEVCNLPSLKALAIMPDVHAGYDLCIGGVALLDNQISPSFVGYDIGCGMTAAQTELHGIDYNGLMRRILFDGIHAAIPVGFKLRDKAVIDYPKFVSASGDRNLEKKVNAKLLNSLGTLGGGNHFIELGISERSNRLCVTIHSGSRNIGHSIADFYMKKGRVFDLDSELGQAYLKDMNFALDYALVNRMGAIMGEPVYCKFCDKLLSESKGEYAHGCLDCHDMPHTYKIERLEKMLFEACDIFNIKNPNPMLKDNKEREYWYKDLTAERFLAKDDVQIFLKTRSSNVKTT